MFVGALTHIGSLKGSIIVHLNHHRYSDTDKDLQKSFWSALAPPLQSVPISPSLFGPALRKLREDPFLNFMEKYYYLILFAAYLLVISIFGFANFYFYFLAPSSAAFLVQKYSALYYHRSGYRNYDLPDKSHNVLWLLPFVFGENWHNNHHKNPRAPNNQVRWWELDVVYFISYPFLKRKEVNS